MTGLSLNFAECKLKNNEFQIKYLPYDEYNSKEAYQLLRGKNRDYHFYRDGTRIYYWLINNSQDDRFRGQIETVSIQTHPFLISRILENAVVSFCRNKKKWAIFLDKYDKTWKIESGKDILNNQFEGLIVLRYFKIKAKVLYANGSYKLGLLLSPEIKNKFVWRKSDFVKNGINISDLNSNEEIIYANKKSLKQYLISRGCEAEYKKLFNDESANSKSFCLSKDFISWLNKNRLKINIPSSNEINEIKLEYISNSTNSIKFSNIQPPQRIFYNRITDNKGKSYNDLLKAYKPFSYEVFNNKEIQIGVLCPSEYEGSTEKFLNQLNITLKKDLHLEKIKLKPICVNGLDLNFYKEKLYCEELMNSKIVIVVVNEEQEQLPISNSPYYYCKAKLIGNGIPTQDIKIERIRNLNQYIVNNISLNIYAKIGGTAWTIEKDQKLKDELVIGIGSTTNENNKFILGIAQVFNSDGQYLVGDCAPLSTFDDYAKNLEDYLFLTLNKIFENHLDTSKEFRLIFHLYKSAGKEHEILAVENLIKKFNKYSFKYALVHLSNNHNYNIYYNDGKGIISRGTYIELDKQNSLIHFTPNSRIPLLVSLDKRSTFNDLYDISKQIYCFASLSHRSYKPSKKTVTIMYPSLMARMTEKLKQVEGWDYDRLNFVSEKLWFI